MVLSAKTGAAGGDSAVDQAGLKIERHHHAGASDAFGCHDGAVKFASDNVIGFYVQLPAQPSAIFAEAALRQARVPNCASYASVWLNVQLDREIGLVAPGHDNPGVSFPMTSLGRSDDALGGTCAQHRQHQNQCRQPSGVAESIIHIKKIHPLLAGMFIEKTSLGIDKNDAGRLSCRTSHTESARIERFLSKIVPKNLW